MVSEQRESGLSGRVAVTRNDWVIGLVLAAATAIFVFGHIRRPIMPMEDASMLLRYSQNVARGHGIVWNVGEKPVEGATDFLFMLLIGVVSGVTKIGVKPVAAGILLLSHSLSVMVLYLGLRRLFRAPVLVAAGFAVILGFGWAYHYVDTAFSAPFYGLFALLTWYVGLICVREGVPWRRAALFGALAFVTGLIRPDGVILGGLMLCSVVYGLWVFRGEFGWSERGRVIVCFGAIFAMLGGAYFVWRLHYFGYPFPNPYYIKRGGVAPLTNLKASSRSVVEMLLPVLPVVALGFRSKAARQWMVMWLITVGGFTAIWMRILLDNNHFSRFQYVMVPLSMMTLGGVVADWWREESEEKGSRLGSLKRPLAGMMVGLVLCAIYYDIHLYRKPFSNLGAQNLAARLKPYAGKNYTIVVTEAGDLPFYSEWRAIDAFGLNDAYVAHHGKLLTAEYLDTYRPEIISYRVWGEYTGIDEFRAQLGVGTVQSTNFLTQNDMFLDRYAKERGYVKAAVWGAELCQSDVYWVRGDFADRDGILSAIRDHPYYAQDTGKNSYDFRNAAAPTAPCTAEVYQMGDRLKGAAE